MKCGRVASREGHTKHRKRRMGNTTILYAFKTGLGLEVFDAVTDEQEN